MTLIKALSARYPVVELCNTFDINRSSYYDTLQQRDKVDERRVQLRQQVIQLHAQSRGAVGARTLSAALRAQGHDVGRYKAGSLMQEIGLVSKQLRKHRYKNAEGESRVAANHLDRAFTVQQPNQV